MSLRQGLVVCVATFPWWGTNAELVSAGTTIRAVASGVQTSQEAPIRSPEQPRLRMRTIGQLPDWAKQSWFIRRQLDQPWMLRNVNVIDVRQGQIKEHVNIIIVGDEIQSIGTHQPPARMRVVEAAGHYVIPGLFDLHAHVMPKSLLFPSSLWTETFPRFRFRNRNSPRLVSKR